MSIASALKEKLEDFNQSPFMYSIKAALGMKGFIHLSDEELSEMEKRFWERNDIKELRAQRQLEQYTIETNRDLEAAKLIEIEESKQFDNILKLRGIESSYQLFLLAKIYYPRIIDEISNGTIEEQKTKSDKLDRLKLLEEIWKGESEEEIAARLEFLNLFPSKILPSEALNIYDQKAQIWTSNFQRDIAKYKENYSDVEWNPLPVFLEAIQYLRLKFHRAIIDWDLHRNLNSEEESKIFNPDASGQESYFSRMMRKE